MKIIQKYSVSSYLKVNYFVRRNLWKDQYSNSGLVLILLTSSLSIISLRLLRISSAIFNEQISKIACIIYICNPYIYYSLSGGITNFLILGVSFVMYIFSRSFNKGYKLTRKLFI